ncbi:hypothetical protein VNO78_20579 [Psophocarpus tetragonolobus]|uniref:Uncharacterized protein n=1 Tax=Psophocarpus tetragonolobus TaxID=3891 RepID=A0AAN9S9N6_PSOTE
MADYHRWHLNFVFVRRVQSSNTILKQLNEKSSEQGQQLTLTTEHWEYCSSSHNTIFALERLKLEARMRRACRKIWRSVPCTSRKSLRTDSRKDMEEILRAKLSTIKEEPEFCEENLTSPRHMRMAKKQGKKVQAKDKSYVLFIAGFASKGTFAGFLQR